MYGRGCGVHTSMVGGVGTGKLHQGISVLVMTSFILFTLTVFKNEQLCPKCVLNLC